MVDPLSTTIAGIGMEVMTSVAYDYVKGKIEKTLEPDFAVVYNESVQQVVTDNGRRSKYFLKRFFKSYEVKKLACDFRIPRDEKVKKLSKLTKLKSSESQMDIEKVISEFYNLFKNKICSNQTLYNKILERYQSTIIKEVLATGKKVKNIEGAVKVVQEMLESARKERKEILEKLDSEAEIKVIKRKGSFPLLVPIKQYTIRSVKLIELVNNVKNFPYLSKESYEILEDKSSLFSFNYVPLKENNVIKLEHKGIPYKIIYPPQNKIHVVIDYLPKLAKLKITIFSSETLQIRRIHDILFGNLNPSFIVEVDFRGKMKKLASAFIGDISIFDFDPNIYKPVDVEGIRIEARGKRQIMYGEKGFFRRPELKELLSKIKIEREGQITDIYFVRILETNKFSEYPITIDVDYRGRVVGHFPRNKTTEKEARKIIVEFIKKYSS